MKGKEFGSVERELMTSYKKYLVQLETFRVCHPPHTPKLVASWRELWFSWHAKAITRC